MTQLKLSRRKFMDTSSAVAASIMALNVNRTSKALTQANSTSPEAIMNLSEQIAPSGVVQNRVTGELKEELAQLTGLASTKEYEALAGRKTLAAASNNTPDRHQEVSQRVESVHNI